MYITTVKSIRYVVTEKWKVLYKSSVASFSMLVAGFELEINNIIYL